MQYLIILTLFILQGCNPWQNEEKAILKDVVELNDQFFGYYSQEMWDGTIQFLIVSDSKLKKTIESPLGKPLVNEGTILVNDFKQPNYQGNVSLEIKKGVVVFCSASGCKNITNEGIGRDKSAPML